MNPMYFGKVPGKTVEACCDGLVQAILSEEDEVRRVVLRGQASKYESQNYLKP